MGMGIEGPFRARGKAHKRLAVCLLIASPAKGEQAWEFEGLVMLKKWRIELFQSI
jgi:hypothetical protein